MSPSLADGKIRVSPLRQSGIVGARKDDIHASAFNHHIGLIVIHVARDRADRVHGGRGDDLVVVGLHNQVLVREDLVVELIEFLSRYQYPATLFHIAAAIVVHDGKRKTGELVRALLMGLFDVDDKTVKVAGGFL